MSSLNNGSHEKAEATYASATTTGPSPHLRVLGNPAPLGLFAFAGTTYILSMFNVVARDITVPNVVLGMAIFYGGLAQLLAGMWEFAAGNTFGATAFSSYGAFWLSFATFYIPDFAVVASYKGDVDMLEGALGIYLSCWFIITFLFLIASLRSNVALVGVFFFLTITFMLLMISKFTGSLAVQKAGGALGIVTAFNAFYVGLAAMMVKPHGIVQLPTVPLRRD
jgi:succinate-acetate transporter protein